MPLASTLYKLEDKDFVSPEYQLQALENTQCMNDARGVPSAILDLFLYDKIKFLREVITEINHQIKVRQELAEKFVEEIDTELSECRSLMAHLNLFVRGQNPGADAQRVQTQKQISSLNEQKRVITHSCWADLQLLRKELNQALSEYLSLMKIKDALSL